ncbi:MAG: hypothetical protein KIT31_06110 [Deltaproteobacteria bacterium]|nr:hypothetical protein [Deltaproteobacteria bacterium]
MAAVVLVGTARPALADDDDDDEDSVDATDKKRTEENDDGDPDKPKAKQGGDGTRDGRLKQDLTGHDLPTNRKKNQFERDRFFVDKVDTKKTLKKTLVQGSLTGTQFLYRESGGTIAPAGAGVPSNSEFTRLFSDLRLQTDFRHISGSKWDARIDVRGRFNLDPGTSTNNFTPSPTSEARTQSGFLGANELDLRELWLIRSGKRSDLFFGRQFIPDLAGIKFDGLRVDYASSAKFTMLAFGGLYPIRGSRSLTTDYKQLMGDPDPNTGLREPAGRFTATAGGGAAYRTTNMYGAFGGVAIAPLSGAEPPRVFATSTGYYRAGPKLDFYHFGVLDLLGSNTGLTNLSAGLNFKPDQRLRATASVNRVDTDTLNVQAQAFLQNPEVDVNQVQNEAFLARIAQNQVRGSLSAGLGPLQRFEITIALALRFRDEVKLTAPATAAPLTVTLPAGRSVEVFGSVVDRRSFKGARLGVDGARIFRVGDVAYQRTSVLTLRGFAARELKSGKGEWEAEVQYAQTKDDDAGVTCAAGTIISCFGASSGSVISVGGNLFYRFNRDWFGIGGAYLNYQTITHVEMMTSQTDPAILGVTGFGRFARRF